MSARSLEFIVPGELAAATGGYGYDRRIIAGLEALGWHVAVHQLEASFPDPTAAALAHAAAVLEQLPDQALVLIDGLALGAMPQVVQRHADRLQLLGLIHHPLALESGLTPQRALELTASERSALQSVRHVVVTSQRTQRALHSYGVVSSRVSVVEPGTDAAPLARPVRTDTLQMLCMATLIPRKGHDVLFEALARLPPHWHLTCVGSLTLSPKTVDQLRAQCQRLGLEKQITLTGEVPPEEVGRYYEATDLFVLPTRYEGYGMAVAEALAHGIPIISTRVGAIADLVGREAGLLVAPDDVDALAHALERVLTDSALLNYLARGAALIRGSLPAWQDSCARMSHVLEQDYRTRRTP